LVSQALSKLEIEGKGRMLLTYQLHGHSFCTALVWNWRTRREDVRRIQVGRKSEREAARSDGAREYTPSQSKLSIHGC
jgi:hypothetical protein